MALELIKEEESLAADRFGEMMKSRGADEPAWLRLMRQKSFDRFESAGFPSVKEEDWKYTNVAPLARKNWLPVFEDNRSKLTGTNVSPFFYEETRQSTAVFVNGIFQPELSSLRALPTEVSVIGFAEALAATAHGELVREHLEQYRKNENGFTALNSAFASGLLVFIPTGVTVDAPIHLLFFSEPATGRPRATSPRVLIAAEENSSITIVESYVSVESGEYLTNSIIDLTLEKGAQVHHYKIQRESQKAFHVASTRAEVGADAKYRTTSINLGAALSRHDIAVTFEEEGGECAVDGLYLISDEQHSDTHSVIDHRQPHCTSRQLYKGVLDGKSHAVFNGKVFVRHGAQQTDAQQTNKNLLLSEDARVDTKPQLEIFADDVKCAHGAAVGQLSEDEVFYLESRGINPTLARNLLTYGFAKEVIERIKIDSIRKELDEVVLNRLHSGLEID